MNSLYIFLARLNNLLKNLKANKKRLIWLKYSTNYACSHLNRSHDNVDSVRNFINLRLIGVVL